MRPGEMTAKDKSIARSNLRGSEGRHTDSGELQQGRKLALDIIELLRIVAAHNSVIGRDPSTVTLKDNSLIKKSLDGLEADEKFRKAVIDVGQPSPFYSTDTRRLLLLEGIDPYIQVRKRLLADPYSLFDVRMGFSFASQLFKAAADNKSIRIRVIKNRMLEKGEIIPQ
jgi:hypothetical protein